MFFPYYPDCLTSGDTVEEALEHAKDAIALHLEGLADEGLDLHLELAHVSHVVVSEIQIEIPEYLSEKAAAEAAYLQNRA